MDVLVCFDDLKDYGITFCKDRIRILVKKGLFPKPVRVGAYRIAFRRPKAKFGAQTETLGGRPLWILPNPSGLNAHYLPAALAQLFGDLHVWAIAQHARRRNRRPISHS